MGTETRHKLSPRGLRFKFIGIVLLCLTGTIFSTAYYMLEKERDVLMQTARQQATSLTKASAILFTNTFIYEELDMLDESDMIAYLSYYVSDVMRTDPRILAFTVVDKHGREVVSKAAHAGRDHAAAPRISPQVPAEASVQLLGTGADAVLAVQEPLSIESKTWGACQLLFSLRDIEKARISVRNEILAISAGWLLFSLIIVGFGAEYLITALQKLSDAMVRFTVHGDFSEPFPNLPPRKDEIGQLQHSFEWMVQRLRREEQERAQTKKKLFHTEKMATIGQLTASIAHEVNNPLGGVMLCFNNLVKGNLDDAGREQHIEVINSGLSRIRKIMGDLLDYSRQSSLNMQQAGVDDVVGKSVSLLELFSQKKRVSLSALLPGETPPILMDSTKIQQVLVNLLLNAIHATPEGGAVTLEGQLHDDSFTFIISDTGPGIDKAIQGKIFDPFFTTKGEKGTGLGLALAKSIVDQHGGRLELVQSTARGSIFAIHLPRTGKDT